MTYLDLPAGLKILAMGSSPACTRGRIKGAGSLQAGSFPDSSHHDGKIVMRQWVDDGCRRIPAGPDGFLRTRLPSQCKIGEIDRTKIEIRGSIPSWPLWDMSLRLPALHRKTNSPPLHPGFSATMAGPIRCCAPGWQPACCSPA